MLNKAEVSAALVAKSEGGDVLSGRAYIWRSVLQDVELFGGGAISSRYGLDSHNTHLWVIGTKGPLALLFYVLAEITTLFLAIRIAARRIRDNAYMAAPLFLVVNYIVLGISESVIAVLGDGIQMTYVLAMGLTANMRSDPPEVVHEDTICT